jgi:acyl dehydratase
MTVDLADSRATCYSPERSWISADAILYDLGVGAVAADPLAEVEFTTENSHGLTQQVLPTFVMVIGSGQDDGGPGQGDFAVAQLLHAEQSITVHGALPPVALHSRGRLAGFYDTDTDALIVMDSETTDVATGELIAETRTSLFAPSEGGFDSPRADSEPWQVPDRPADHVVTYRTREDQALLCHRSGDRNPLHSDTWLAVGAGFDRAILQGLCSYGFTSGALLRAVCDCDPARFRSMQARFSAPVRLGDTLDVHVWDEGDVCLFRAYVGQTAVLDRGLFRKKEK